MPRKARRVLRLLERIQGGALTVHTPTGETLRFGSGKHRGTIELRNWNVFGDTIRSGDIGFAEGFMRGDWTTDDLPGLLELLIANRNRLEQVVYGTTLGRFAHRVRHLFNRNSRNGARRNIQAHYDLGNSFYALWLDRGMTYSSALFDGAGEQTLEQAQARKIERAIGQLALPADASLLEIGCGWGSLAEAADGAGIRYRGLTLSDEQLDWAKRRLGETSRCEFVLQDYRDEQGQFDAIVSIEMFEAVGEAYWRSYFEAVKRCLKPGGRAVVQTITIADELFERYRSGTDFIQQYVFPGGMLPSPQVFRRESARHGLKVVDTFAFGPDYARTLALWRDRLTAADTEVRSLGFDDAFMRTWFFYLAYCEAAFAQNNTDVIQFTLTHA